MGFNEGDCELALRAALGNPDRAADYILSGQIPAIPQMISTADVPMDEVSAEEDDQVILSDNDEMNEEEDEQDQLRRFTQFRNQLIRDPASLRAFLRQMSEENPSVAGLIRDDPAAFLASIGLNPDDFDLAGLGRVSEYERVMSELSEHEQSVVHGLEKIAPNLDTMTVIQVFVACDKDENVARACIQSMQ
jgi:UV excision repair protein RAD23